ncbi:MAG: pyrroline-5-carboxylate reductase [Agathobaculum sp.]|jgi:pyrroline-5-carboxylate reductase|uniref:pyrroline-5-carboxylate reductase n=1 Tax=Agathobaculum sp. TaxID=2048138 RepID=UPI003D8BF9C0
MKKYRFGVIGAGNMGMAIVRGAVGAGLFAPEQALLCNRSAQKRAAHAAEGYAVTDDNTQVYTQCETVLLAVKPQNFDAVLPALGLCGGEKPLVVSIAAGVSFAKMEAALGADTAIIRVMPNTPLMLGAGAAQLVKNAAASAEQLAAVRTLFDTMGVTAVFEEERMLNEVIPYAGSAPAYLYAFADAMVQSAAQHGIAEADALSMFCQTMIGSAQMLLRGDKTPAELISAVCSPGGTTLEGMKVLEDRKFYEIVAEMCDKCIARAYELGK